MEVQREATFHTPQMFLPIPAGWNMEEIKLACATALEKRRDQTGLCHCAGEEKRSNWPVPLVTALEKGRDKTGLCHCAGEEKR